MIYLVAAFFGVLVMLHHIYFDLGIQATSWGLRYVLIWAVWTTSLSVMLLLFRTEGLI